MRPEKGARPYRVATAVEAERFGDVWLQAVVRASGGAAPASPAS
jgi:hypothetical protein